MSHGLKCHRCDRVTKAAKLTSGWKRHNHQIWCKTCWRDSYVLRALTIPIARAVDRTAKELWDTLKSCWAQSTEVANATITELAKADVVRSAEMEKLPKPPNLYLYPLGRQRRPDMTPASVTALQQSVSRRYNKARYDLIWLSGQSLPRYRYPVPFPVHNQAYVVHKNNNGWVVQVRLNGERWSLCLRGGHEFRRQLKMLDQIIDGTAIQGEMSILRRRQNKGDRRNSGSQRGNGERVSYRAMAKIVAWFPRRSAANRCGVLRVTTQPDAFVRAYHDDRQDAWVYHANHVRTWIFRYSKWLQEQADDSKFERRFPRRRRGKTLDEYDRKAQKHRDRLNTFCQQVSASVAKYASRQRLAVVEYDDSCREYCATFPWHRMPVALAKACEDAGIGFNHVKPASGDVVDDNSATAREE